MACNRATHKLYHTRQLSLTGILSMRLDGEAAIVTGAASGIGWATVARFLEEGARVCLFDLQEEKASGLIADLTADQRKRAAFYTTDVSDEASVTSSVASAAAQMGTVTILVNCAAAQTPATTVEHLPLEEWSRAFSVNVTGSFLASKAVIPFMHTAGRGSIIHVASQLGSVAMPGFSAYCATKGAILQLCKTMALDHASDNIRVNSVSPGATLTERLRNRFGSDDAAFDALGADYPMGRLAQPHEIANGILYLASEEAGFMTGSDLVIDGGYLAR